MQVEKLRPDLKDVKIRVRVVSVFPPREVVSRKNGTTHTLQEVLVGDPTGSVIVTLWDDDVGKLEEGKSYEINNAYTSLVRGSLRVNIGRRGTITEIDQDVDANASNNISEKRWNTHRRYKR